MSFKQKKKLNFNQFCNFKRALGKSVFLKIAQAFEARDFFTFSSGFWIFEAHNIINIFLIRKDVYVNYILIIKSIYKVCYNGIKQQQNVMKIVKYVDRQKQ